MSSGDLLLYIHPLRAILYLWVVCITSTCFHLVASFQTYCRVDFQCSCFLWKTRTFQLFHESKELVIQQWHCAVFFSVFFLVCFLIRDIIIFLAIRICYHSPGCLLIAVMRLLFILLKAAITTWFVLQFDVHYWY